MRYAVKARSSCKCFSSNAFIYMWIYIHFSNSNCAPNKFSVYLFLFLI